MKMTCECYTEVEGKLLELFKEQMPEGSRDLSIDVKGYLFGMSDEGMTHRSSNEVKVVYMTPKKTGGMKKVTKSTFVRASFCPFCGVAYD